MDPSCTVLVVDDDIKCQTFLGEFLGLLGYRVEMASDGMEALERLEDPAMRPCVIILDLMMPVMSGWEFRREQVLDPRLASIPVVFVSGVVKDLSREVEAAQVKDFLRKPFDLNALAAAVNRHCLESRA
jgi:CheY-like chemotaxis protein